MSFGQYSENGGFQSTQGIRGRGRVRRVYPGKEITHLWARQSQEEARTQSGNLYFQDDTIYSYGSHFPIARHVRNAQGEAAVLFTSRRYSVTTSKHIVWVRTASRHLRTFVVEHPDYEPADCLTFLSRLVRESLVRAASANRVNRPKHLSTAIERRKDAVEFAEFFSLDASDIPTIPDAEHVAEVVAQWRADEDERVENFRANPQPNYARLEDGSALLALVGDGIVTSLGAAFPVRHAIRGLRLVRAVVARGKEWHRNGETCRLGFYQIDSISAQGDVMAGCHRVSYAEIERLAPQLDALTTTETE